jgi:hypothetical protein
MLKLPGEAGAARSAPRETSMLSLTLVPGGPHKVGIVGLFNLHRAFIDNSIQTNASNVRYRETQLETEDGLKAACHFRMGLINKGPKWRTNGR